MKQSRFLALILALLMMVSLLPAVAAAEGELKLTYYSTSAEVNAMFEEMFVTYHELNPNVTIELIPTGVGQGQQEQLQSLYASGNAPTFMNIDPANVLDYQDKLYVFDPATDMVCQLQRRRAGSRQIRRQDLRHSLLHAGLCALLQQARGGIRDPGLRPHHHQHAGCAARVL